jgi:hypothetical protein
MSWVLFPFGLFNYPLEAFQRRGSIAMLAGLQGVAVWESFGLKINFEDVMTEMWRDNCEANGNIYSSCS